MFSLVWWLAFFGAMIVVIGFYLLYRLSREIYGLARVQQELIAVVKNEIELRYQFNRLLEKSVTPRDEPARPRG